MFTPKTITGGLIVDPSKELEFFGRYLVPWDAELMAKFALGCATHPLGSCLKIGASFAGNSKGVRATSVGPHGCKIVSAAALVDEPTRTHQET